MTRQRRTPEGAREKSALTQSPNEVCRVLRLSCERGGAQMRSPSEARRAPGIRERGDWGNIG
eukprot:11610967-Alexandrium_andersonii.AAC.2